MNVALQKISKRFELIPPKTERSRRTLKVPVSVLASLKVQRVRQLERKLFAGADWVEWDLVFTTWRGTPLGARNVLRAFYADLKTAKLDRMRFHDLRHSCASLLLAQGVAPRTIMEVLGHFEIRLTMDTYSHVMPAMVDEAALAMDKALPK